MMKPLFRRTYQSKTNCCGLGGGGNLLYVRELGKIALRGFLLVLNFHISLAAQEQEFLLEKSLSRRVCCPPGTKLAGQDSWFPGEEVRADVQEW